MQNEGVTTREQAYRQLREYATHLRPPPPFSDRFEISGNTIVMMISPAGRHERAAWMLAHQLQPQLPDGIIAHTGGDVEDVALGILRRPDLVVMPFAATDTDNAFPAEAVELAVEIVSPSNPENDYQDKIRDYPAMGIPHYLIVDPRNGTAHHHWSVVTKYGDPAYDNHVAYVFGETIPIGAWIIETAGLPRYGDTTP
jgi:Uma2 family endonuclease